MTLSNGHAAVGPETVATRSRLYLAGGTITDAARAAGTRAFGPNGISPAKSLVLIAGVFNAGGFLFLDMGKP